MSWSNHLELSGLVLQWFPPLFQERSKYLEKLEMSGLDPCRAIQNIERACFVSQETNSYSVLHNDNATNLEKVMCLLRK